MRVPCGQFTLWMAKMMVYPISGNAPPPSLDLPKEIARDFNEARYIVRISPRGAAAPLRLAIQKLCKELGQPGKKIDDDIKALVAGGLWSR